MKFCLQKYSRSKLQLAIVKIKNQTTPRLQIVTELKFTNEMKYFMLQLIFLFQICGANFVINYYDGRNINSMVNVPSQISSVSSENLADIYARLSGLSPLFLEGGNFAYK